MSIKFCIVPNCNTFPFLSVIILRIPFIKLLELTPSYVISLNLLSRISLFISDVVAFDDSAIVLEFEGTVDVVYSTPLYLNST